VDSFALCHPELVEGRSQTRMSFTPFDRLRVTFSPQPSFFSS
jgi:hypothetical protein